jgi:5-deoxy-glucuronate isomerase
MAIEENFVKHSLEEDMFVASIMGRDLSTLGFMVLRLKPQKIHHISTLLSEEKVCILISGKAVFQANCQERTMHRVSPIKDLPCGAFVPAGCNLTIQGIGKEVCIIAVATAKIQPEIECLTDKKLTHVEWIDRDKINVYERGFGSYQRTIRSIIDSHFPARSLICGETINPSGNWSSFPPHKHDIDLEKESAHEEIYLHIFEPSQGWGYQEIYSSRHNVKEVFRIENGDVVLIPFGYHPVTCAPGYTLCYLWVLAGTSRKLEISEDPAHVWLNHAN